MERRSVVLLLILAALWGSSYMFIKIGLDDLSPAMIVFVRTALAALVLLPLALRRNALVGLRPILGLLVVLAAIQVAAPFLLISYGEEHISSGLAGVLVASAPIFTALLAPFFDVAERSSGIALLGIAVGIVGVGLILGVDLEGAAIGGGLMVLGATIGYAVGGFIVKKNLAGFDPIGLVTATMTLSALLSLPLAAATAPSGAPSGGTIGAMLALGIGGTGVAFAIYYTLIASLGPAKASLVAYIAPIFAVFYGVTLRDEPLTVTTVVGMVLIVGGSWLAARTGKPAAVRAEPAAVPQPGR